jgi:Tol biopolymer transport system component
MVFLITIQTKGKIKMKILILISCMLLLAVIVNAQQTDFPKLTGLYLGQKPPGKTPQQFAANIFDSTFQGFHSNIIFSPDGKEAYWQLNQGHGSKLQGILESRYENGVWKKPKVAFFSTLVEGGLDDAPFISPDGKKFFFLSYRPIKRGDKPGKCNIWVMDKTDEGWSKPKPLPPIVNSLKGIHWMLSVDLHGNLYFGTWQPQENGKTTGDIYCSKYENGQYTQPEKLGPEINIPGYNYSPFIAPDGSYLIFSRKEPSKPTKLFICFQKSEGKWTKPQDLSKLLGLSSKDSDILQGDCPLVTTDGKYLFFRDDLNGSLRPFWIDAGFIEELRPKE